MKSSIQISSSTTFKVIIRLSVESVQLRAEKIIQLHSKGSTFWLVNRKGSNHWFSTLPENWTYSNKRRLRKYLVWTHSNLKSLIPGTWNHLKDSTKTIKVRPMAITRSDRRWQKMKRELRQIAKDLSKLSSAANANEVSSSVNPPLSQSRGRLKRTVSRSNMMSFLKQGRILTTQPLRVETSSTRAITL